MKQTKDILFVAWLEVVKNEQFVEYNVIGHNRKIASFDFNISDDNWAKYKKEFYDSDTTKTRYVVQRIKDLIN